MNAPLLILPALLGTLVLSAAKTLPADLRHDAQGKAPLTVARMTSARGAGSTCRLGCNEPDVPCHEINGPDDSLLGYQKQIWHSHLECAFALGSYTCSAAPEEEDECNTIYNYGVASDGCSGPPDSVVVTSTSVCVIAM